jgi:hypothetical protein
VLAANLALRFLLELAALGAIGAWCASAASGVVAALLATAAVVAAAFVWGTLCSPRARVTLASGPKLAVQFAVFGVATAGLLALRLPMLAATFAVLVVINILLLPDHGTGRAESPSR